MLKGLVKLCPRDTADLLKLKKILLDKYVISLLIELSDFSSLGGKDEVGE